MPGTLKNLKILQRYHVEHNDVFPCVRMARASMRVYPSRMSVYTVRMAKPNVAFWPYIDMNLSTDTTARCPKYEPLDHQDHQDHGQPAPGTTIIPDDNGKFAC